MLEPSIKRNDPKAKKLILTVSISFIILFLSLGRVKLNLDLGFDSHIFALFNAIINTCVSIVLVWALIAIKQKKYQQHKNLMLSALLLSAIFLISYVIHHLLNEDTRFGGEGVIKTFYYIILGTHIPLAGIMLPFILFAAYRGLAGDYKGHKKLVRFVFPLWLYVSITGVLIYILISPYYQ